MARFVERLVERTGSAKLAEKLHLEHDPLTLLLKTVERGVAVSDCL
jgi:hypothetical protein